MEDVIQYWSFVATALILAVIGQIMKNTVFTSSNIVKYKLERPWLGTVLWWGLKTLPAHPVFIGIAISFIPGMPVASIVKNQAAITLYYAFAGVVSTWAFSVVKSLAKREGLELDFGDEKTIPPEQK